MAFVRSRYFWKMKDLERFVYAVLIGGRVRYIGQTSNPEQRAMFHVGGHDPVTGPTVRRHGDARMLWLDAVGPDDGAARHAESAWVRHATRQGCHLLNRPGSIWQAWSGHVSHERASLGVGQALAKVHAWERAIRASKGEQ